MSRRRIGDRAGGTQRPAATCDVTEDNVAGDIGGSCRREPGHRGPHDPFARSAPPSADKPWRTGRDWRRAGGW